MKGVLVPALALLVPGGTGAQEVSDCGEPPPVTALVEPWEATTAVLAEGAVRLAVLEGEEGTRRLLVLTLPPPGDAPAGDVEGGAAPPPARTCRLVTQAAGGFADLDLSGLDAREDAGAATLTVRVPALGFVPESTELRPQALLLTFGVADGSLGAALEDGPGGGLGDGAAAP